MVRMFFLILSVLGCSLHYAFAQETKGNEGDLPNVQIKDLNGKMVNARSLQNDGKPIVLSFWATWCKPCLIELEILKELYPKWQELYGVKIIAVSIDDVRNSRKVAPFVRSRGWEFEVYIDENSELRRALGVTNIPHTFLLNGDGEIIWQHTGFSPGDEEELQHQLQRVSESQPSQGEN